MSEHNPLTNLPVADIHPPTHRSEHDTHAVQPSHDTHEAHVAEQSHDAHAAAHEHTESHTAHPATAHAAHDAQGHDDHGHQQHDMHSFVHTKLPSRTGRRAKFEEIIARVASPIWHMFDGAAHR